jgi:uncharacterized membrane protein
MILHVSPDAPPIVHAAAAGLLFLHIGGASVSLIAGPVSILARKGGRLHKAAGNVFFAAMLTMSGVGAGVAPLLAEDQMVNTLAGVFTFYMTATAWAAVKRRPGEIGRFEVGACFVALACAAAGLASGWVNGQLGQAPHGPAAVAPYVFGAVAALAAGCDVSVILRYGVSGAARVARHLWRMSLALLMVVASFAGQPKAQPAFLRDSPLLFLPMLAVLGLMIFWLIRVRFPRGFKPAQTAPYRSEALRASRAAAPGVRSASPSWLSGVFTVPR